MKNQWNILFQCMSFVLKILTVYPLKLTREKREYEGSEKHCQTNNNDTWYYEDLNHWCCPCSKCDYGAYNDKYFLEDCSEDHSQFFCRTRDQYKDCLNELEFLKNRRASATHAVISNSSDSFPTTPTVATPTSSAKTPDIATTVIDKFSESNLYLAITAVSVLVITLLLIIIVCKKKNLLGKAKHFFLGCQKSDDPPAKKDRSPLPSDSFELTGSEIISEESSLQDSIPSKERVTDKDDTVISHTHNERPEIISGKGGRDDLNPSISLPPYTSGSSRPPNSSPSYQRQSSGNSLLRAPTGFESQPFLQTPDLNNPHPNIPGPSHYPTAGGHPTPHYFYSPYPPSVDPMTQQYYSRSTVPFPVGSFIPQTPNYNGSVVLNNVHVSGDLKINNNPGNSDSAPNSSPSVGNPSASVQPSSFTPSELGNTPSCSKDQQKVAEKCKVGQRESRPVRNDYDKAFRRQGSTMEAQSTSKHPPRSDQSHESLSFDLERMQLSNPHSSRLSAFSSRNSETAAKLHDESDSCTSKRKLVSLRSSFPYDTSATQSHARSESESLLRPVQETISDITPNNTSFERVDLYQSRSNSNTKSPC